MPKMGTMANGLPFIDDGFSGEPRILAALPPTRVYRAFSEFGAEFDVIPRAQWQEFDDNDDFRILDQDGFGACVGHGTVGAFEYVYKRHGGTVRTFSAMYMYSLINGGRDQGAVVGDALEALTGEGVCLESTVPPEKKWIYTRQMPAGAKQEAYRFRAGRAFRLQTFDQIVTMVIKRIPCPFGIDIGGAFDPDADGVIPPQRGSGGGHCMYAAGGLRNIRSVWHVKVPNSWSRRWGKDGVCWLPESYFSGSFGDHFALTSPLEDPQEPDPLPKVN